ncbi:MAG: SGNH/GDSL hydrolase family protein [Acidobacteria bacterium]|nr:SGNH/GDSL hydrolase family protein [Acidobacteriota bacterium]
MRLAAATMGLVVAGLLLEGALRVVQRKGSTTARRAIGIHERHRASIDRPHFRRPRPRRRSAEPFHILVVGDSFTWGDGIYHADTYAQRIESLLERMDHGLDVRVSMYSRPGWNTQQEYQMVRLHLRRLDPDLIVLGYCLNDAELRQRRGNDDIMEPLTRRRPTSGLERLLSNGSRLYSWVWERVENGRQRRAFNHYYHELYSRPGWQEAQAALDGFRQLSWEHNIPLAVLLFPIFDQQLDSSYSYRDLHRLVMNALRELDIPAVDLLPAYRGVDAVRLAVEPFTDPHPNELAHRIASQYLVDFLVREELVPITPTQRDRVELSLPRRKRG